MKSSSKSPSISKHNKDLEFSTEDFIEEVLHFISPDLSKRLKKEITKILNFVGVKSSREDHYIINRSITAQIELKAINYLIPRLPKFCTPDLLTLIAFGSAILTGACLIASTYNRNFLFIAILGLFIHWFGDSLDGALARYQKRTSPKYGYYVDHLLDSVSVSIICLGIGLSEFANLGTAMTFACAFLLIMVNTYLLKSTIGVLKLSFGVMGPTESRIGAALLMLTMYFLPIYEIKIAGYILTQYDICLLIGSSLVVSTLGFDFIKRVLQLKRIDRKDRKKKERRTKKRSFFRRKKK